MHTFAECQTRSYKGTRDGEGGIKIDITYYVMLVALL